MNKTGVTIAKNASVLMASQLITWALAMVLNIAMPRYLGPVLIGKYALAMSLLAITSMFAGFGMERMFTREIARKPGRLNEMFGTVIVLRGGFLILGFIILALYVRLAGYPADTVTVVVIFMFSAILDQVSLIIASGLQGLERMEYISIGLVASKLFATVISLLLLFLKQGLFAISAVSVGASIIYLTILLFAVRRIANLQFHFKTSLVKELIITSFPFMLSMAFLTLYQKMDIVVISWLANESEIGWYSASSTLFGSLLFIPTIFMTAVFPAMARFFVSEADKSTQVLQKSFNFLLLLGVPIGLGMLTISNPLTVLLYGPDFTGSGPILAIMGIVTILTYLNILFGQYMTAANRQNTWTAIMAVGAVCTIPLDLLFMPWCRATFGNGAIGGGLSFVCTELGMVIAGLVLIPRGVLNRENTSYALKVLCSGAVMAVTVWQLRNMFIAIPILAGMIVYPLAILVLKTIPPQDWIILKTVFSMIITRISRKRFAANEIAGK